MTPLHRDENIRDLCAEALAGLADISKAVKIATVVSDDGFEVASLNVDAANGSRLASMTSSMQALGDAVIREMKMRDAKYLLIEAAKVMCCSNVSPAIPSSYAPSSISARPSVTPCSPSENAPVPSPRRCPW